MELWQKQALFAENVAALINHIHDKGYSCTLGEAYRTPEQAEIYAKEGKGIVDSLHCKRLAIDLNLFDAKGTWIITADGFKQFGEYWESLHELNRWGGNFPEFGGKICDADHFEMQDK